MDAQAGAAGEGESRFLTDERGVNGQWRAQKTLKGEVMEWKARAEVGGGGGGGG